MLGPFLVDVMVLHVEQVLPMISVRLQYEELCS